jgi:thiol-disulfide isomerase/thioredoxin
LLTIPLFVGACAAALSPAPTTAPTTAAPTVPKPPVEAKATTQSAAPAAQPTMEAALPAAITDFRADLPDLGVAPELNNEVWLNTDRPLKLAELRGKVVLLDMWTFDCINCRNVIPSLRDWYNTYTDQGLVVIGNHYPEFDFERDLNNLKDALVRLDVPYAVAQDNDGGTWRAYRTRYWPSLFLIDKQGHLRYTHIGEGAYTTTEQAIQDLLKETY